MYNIGLLSVEYVLVSALKKQGKKLAIVLRKASELAMPQLLPHENTLPIEQQQQQHQYQREVVEALQQQVQQTEQAWEESKRQIVLLEEQVGRLQLFKCESNSEYFVTLFI